MQFSQDVKKIISKIEALLNKHKTKTEWTHISMGGTVFRGKFDFSDKKDRKELNKLISKLADSDVNLAIAEKPKDYGPVKIDIDLNYPVEMCEKERLYDEELVHEVIGIYRDIIKKYCDVNDEDLQAFLFEKEKMGVKNEEYKDGFHVIFPHLNLYHKTRYNIVDEVIKYTNENNTFNNDKYQFTNANIVDKAIVQNNAWMLYSCCKPGSSPYKLTKILDINNDVLEHDFTNYDLIKKLSLRDSKWSYAKMTPYNDGYDDNVISETYSEIGGNKEQPSYTVTSEQVAEQIEQATKYVQLLTTKRANDYESWIRVGWALHNTHPSLLSTWITFSQRSPKFVDGDCETRWENMKDGGFTIRSLAMWAKEDSPDEYKAYIKENLNYLIKQSNDISNTFSIAKALHYKYKDQFLCADPKNHIWFYYSNHKWNRTNNGGKLITLMSQDFSTYFAKKEIEIKQKGMCADEITKKTLFAEGETYGKIARKLLDISFKEKIIKEAQYLFQDEKFYERLNQKRHLIGFTNGVYDLIKRKFRDGYPDDHISMTTGVAYQPYNPNNPYMKVINEYFSKVLTNKNVREYFLSRLSSCVSGENREEKVYFCTGSGSNAKSLTFSLVAKALGDYYISCPITIITRKRGGAGMASPELERLDGPRCAVFQEPEGDENISVGIFKELSGNDKFMVRGLYKEPREIQPQIKYWLTCNDLPKIPSDDGGTWRRIRVIHFASKFVEKPDPKIPNQFPLDSTLKEKIDMWAPTFASYLIHIYNTKYNIDKKIPEPEEVLAATNEYRKGQDLLREFFETKLVITDDSRDKLQKKIIRTAFKNWAKDEKETPQPPKPDRLYDIIKEELEKKYGDGKYRNGWKYLAFNLDDEEEEEKNDTDSDGDIDV